MKEPLFPGLNNMSVDEVVCFTKSCTKDGFSIEKTSEMISCIDDLLSIQNLSVMINSRSGKVRHTKKKTKEVIEARILAAEF